MRLLHCISSLETGGAERQLGLLAAAQAERHEVHVAFVRAGPHLEALERAGVHPHPIGVASNTDPRLVWALARLSTRVNPALVQTWLTQMDVAAGLATRLTGRPWVLAERSSAAAYPASWKQSLRARLARSADLIVANSEGGAAYWTAAAPATPRRVIGNALPLDRIRNAPAVDLPPNAVVFVGRLSAEKRVATLLHALADGSPPADAQLFLCGDGPERAALEALAARLGLADRVRFLGRRDDAWSVIRSAAVVVNPSAFEGRPNAVLEAMAAGRPVIVSDIPAHREILDSTSAWFVDPENPTQLAEAIRAALTDRSDVGARTRAAGRRVEPFDLPRIVEQYDRAYDAVLAGRRPRRSA